MLRLHSPSRSIHRVFISYRDTGKAEARKLKRRIQERWPWVKAWIWEGEVRIGQDIEEQYRKALRMSDMFVPVLTADYEDGKGTRDELRIATELRSERSSHYPATSTFIIPLVPDGDFSRLDQLDLGMRNAAKSIDEVLMTIEENLKDIEKTLNITRIRF